MSSNIFQQEIRWLLEEKYTGKKTAEAKKDIARLERGEHVDYVIGWVDFLGCRIDLSRKPLIPRVETEYWTEKIIEELRRRSSRNRAPYPSLRSGPRPNPTISQTPPPPLSVLDIFAGSGCIGVAVLKHIPLALVDFAEKEERFLKQIVINTKLNKIDSKRYRIIQSDIFSGVKGKARPEIFKGYDIILANPPYVAEARMEEVQRSVLDNEPADALFAGEDGLFYIRQFLEQTKEYLKENGVVYMEFDSPQKQAIVRLLKELGYRDFEFFKDQYNKWRYARIVF